MEMHKDIVRAAVEASKQPALTGVPTCGVRPPLLNGPDLPPYTPNVGTKIEDALAVFGSLPLPADFAKTFKSLA